MKLKRRKKVNLGIIGVGTIRASMPLANEVDLGKGLNPWGFQRKLKPQDTVGMVNEEIAMLKYVEQHQPVKLWAVLNYLGRFAGKHKYQTRSQRQRLMPLSTRLCREGKLKRNRSPNTLSLGPNYRPARPDLAESQPDFGGSVCDVSGMGRIVA